MILKYWNTKGLFGNKARALLPNGSKKEALERMEITFSSSSSSLMYLHNICNPFLISSWDMHDTTLGTWGVKGGAVFEVLHWRVRCYVYQIPSYQGLVT